jgi:hypothetical protein
MGLLNVDLRQIPPQTALTPVPEGWYKVRIVKSNIKTTAKGDGGYLELQHEVLEGQYQNRIIYWNLNLFNPSAQASEIAYKQLSSIGHCLGVFSLQDQNMPDQVVPQLHNQPYYIWVVIGQGNQGPLNNVRGCKDINGNDPGKGAGAAAPAPMQQPGSAWSPAPAPAAATYAPAGGGTAPGGWTPPAQPAPMAAPQGPSGQPWQPGTSTPPQPAWQPNPPPAQPQGQPPAQPTWQPPTSQQQPPQNQPPANSGWQQGAQPTQPAAQPAPPNQAWQQGGQPSNAPWQR